MWRLTPPGCPRTSRHLHDTAPDFGRGRFVVSGVYAHAVPNLRRTAKGWSETAPDACGNGHALVGNMLVGTQACGEHRGAHRTYWCKKCGDTVYRPPMGSACRKLHGAAAVRNL